MANDLEIKLPSPPTDPKTKRLDAYYSGEIGGTGTFELDGYVRDDIIPELSGRQGRKVYAKMRTDTTISSIIFAIEMMLRRCKWECSPASSHDETAIKYAEFFDSLRDDMEGTWENFITNVASMLVYGWSFFEIVCKRRVGWDADPSSRYDDGLWGIKKLAIRNQDTLEKWILDENGNPIGMYQWIYYGANAGAKIIPLDKGLLFRAGFWKDSPEGMSPLRGAYDPWLLLQGINRAEAYGIERELNGLPVVRLPAQVLQGAANGDVQCVQAVERYTQIVRDVRLNKQAGVLLPSDVFENADGTISPQKQYEFSLLSSNGTRAINVQSAAERHQVSIARCVLADFLMLGTTSRSGSQALGKSRFQFFADALDGWNVGIADVLNRQLIPIIARMNGFEMNKLPSYRSGTVQPMEVETIVNCIEKYARAGGVLLPDPRVDETIRNKLGLPLADPALLAATDYDPELDPRIQALRGEGPLMAQNQSNTDGSTPKAPGSTNTTTAGKRRANETGTKSRSAGYKAVG